MRDFLESAAVVLVIILQVINVILNRGVNAKVDEQTERISRMIDPKK